MYLLPKLFITYVPCYHEADIQELNYAAVSNNFVNNIVKLSSITFGFVPY